MKTGELHILKVETSGPSIAIWGWPEGLCFTMKDADGDIFKAYVRVEGWCPVENDQSKQESDK